MGCTGSAPKTSSPNAQTADKSIQFEEETNETPSIEVDVADIEDENLTNDLKVLPPCDTFQQSVQLVRNNKSSASLATAKDVSANGHVIESEIVLKVSENIINEVKIPKLELLMDKVFETNHHLNETDLKGPESEKSDSSNEEPVESTNEDKTDQPIETESSDTPESKHEINNMEEENKEASPSQSQSSRATRWEALADIAAELPPSLAVDPVTGQIYQIALHK